MTKIKIPQVTFKTRVLDESIKQGNPHVWKDLSSKEIFENKRVVLFALPGAYTPTCSSKHLPKYEELYDEIISEKIDEIYCLAVNDAFVMNSWGQELNVKKVKLLPDGSGDFTRFMGMLVKKDNLGFGLRSWRYSMVVNNGVVEKMFVEPGKQDNSSDDPHIVSDAETMLKYLKESF